MVPIAWTYVLRDYQKARLTVVPRPEPRHPGRRLPAVPGADRRRLGRVVRQGPDQRHAERQGDFLPVQAHRLRVRDPGRGARVHRRRSSCSCCSCCCCGASSSAGWRSRDAFGTMFAGGVASMILFQLVVNVGMVLGVMPITGHPAAVRDPRRCIAGQHGRSGSGSSRASTSGRPGRSGERGADPGDRLMDEAAIPHAIELLVGLLGLAAFVAIVARPLRLPTRLPWSSPASLVGHRRERRRVPRRRCLARSSSSSCCCPGLVFEAAYRLRSAELRRWFGGLALLAVPGVLISAAVVALVLNVGDRSAAGPRPSSSARWCRRPTRPRSSRPSSGCGARRRWRPWSTARACSTTGPASSCSRSPSGRGRQPDRPRRRGRRVRRDRRDQRRHRPRDGVRRRRGHRPRRTTTSSS